jgi:hypothetical protein
VSYHCYCYCHYRCHCHCTVTVTHWCARVGSISSSISSIMSSRGYSKTRQVQVTLPLLAVRSRHLISSLPSRCLFFPFLFFTSPLLFSAGFSSALLYSALLYCLVSSAACCLLSLAVCVCVCVCVMSTWTQDCVTVLSHESFVSCCRGNYAPS